MNSIAFPSLMNSPAAESFTSAQRERLGVLLEQYMLGLESGLPPSVQSLARDDPELMIPLENCVSGLVALHAMAANVEPCRASSAARTLGEFELHEEIGRGGMGIVFRATQRSLRRTVAVKLLPFISSTSANHIKRFQNEAEYAASLNHPNIVPVFAFGLESGIHYYAMQWIDGQSLDQWMHARRDVCPSHPPTGVGAEWRTAVGFGMDAAEGLHAAHASGVFHRDVKPSNLLVDTTGKLWLTDFGLAHVPCDASLTRPGDVIGTRKYMSPEQASGKSGLVDARSDIYSLGITLYELLTFRAEAPDAMAPGTPLGLGIARRLRSLRPDLPRDLVSVIATAAAARPEDRYESSHLLAEDLRRVLRGEPTLARPPSLWDQSVLWASRNRTPVLASALVGLLVTLGSLFAATAIWELKRVSDSNLVRAERGEQLARGAVEHLGSQMAELLADVPSAISVRKKLLDETLSYYEKFVDRAKGDPKLQHELALTYGKIGALQLELRSNNEAIAALQQSEERFAQLAAENREDPDRLLHWSTSQNNLARALQQHGQTVEAASLFSRALALLRVIQARSNLDIRKPMATTENNLGRLLAQTGSPVEAAKYFTHAIELLDAAESDGLLMGYVQHNTACLLAPTSPERALDHGTRALKIFDKVRQAERNNSKVASQTAETLAVLGNVRIRLGHLQEGIDALQQSVDLLQPMVAHLPFPLERPEQVEPVEQIALGWYQLGMAHATSHDSKIAIAALDRAANYQRWVVDAAPNRADASATMASILCQLGKMQLAIDRRDTAKSMLEEAVSRQKMAVLSEPDSRRYRDALLAYEDQLGKL